MQQAFAIFFVIIFVLGTAASAFVFQPTAVTTDANATAVALQATPTPQAAVPSELVKKGDDAAATGAITDALSFYQAAVALDQSNADLHYKIGDLLIQTGSYASAADQLARAVELDQNGPIGAKAKALMNQNKDVLPTRVIGTSVPGATGVVTGTQTLTGAAPITNTEPILDTVPLTNTAPLTDTNPNTGVNPSGAAPTATK